MAILSHTPHPSFGRRSTSGRSFAGGFTALTSSCPRGTFSTFVGSQFWGSCHKLPIHVALGISSQSSIMAKCACLIYECHCSLSQNLHVLAFVASYFTVSVSESWWFPALAGHLAGRKPDPLQAALVPQRGSAMTLHLHLDIPWPIPKNTTCYRGFPIDGGTHTWFISWKIPIQNGWWPGVPLF